MAAFRVPAHLPSKPNESRIRDSADTPMALFEFRFVSRQQRVLPHGQTEQMTGPGHADMVLFEPRDVVRAVVALSRLIPGQPRLEGRQVVRSPEWPFA